MTQSQHISQRFLQQFDLRAPIMQGPMGGVSGPRLVAAVSEAGALGTLPIWALPSKLVAATIQQTQSLTQRRFAVNLRADLMQHEHIAIALDCGITDFHLFWGDPAASMPRLRSAGATVLSTVSDSDSTAAALDAGITTLIAQGIEAGGHVRSEIPLLELLQQTIAQAGSNCLVLAAGGCANAQDLAQQLQAGAAGVVLGTRFAASTESDAHPDYKQALLDADSDATVRSVCFDDGWTDAPHRTLINDTWRHWHQAGEPQPGERPGEAEEVMQSAGGRAIRRYSMNPPGHTMTGHVVDAAMYAGTSASKLATVLPAAAIVSALSPSKSLPEC